MSAFERWSPPIVRVGNPYIMGTRTTTPDALAAWCSDCGDLSEWEGTDDATRHRLQRLAHEHAEEKHEGLVDALGWVR